METALGILVLIDMYLFFVGLIGLLIASMSELADATANVSPPRQGRVATERGQPAGSR